MKTKLKNMTQITPHGWGKSLVRKDLAFAKRLNKNEVCIHCPVCKEDHVINDYDEDECHSDINLHYCPKCGSALTLEDIGYRNWHDTKYLSSYAIFDKGEKVNVTLDITYHFFTKKNRYVSDFTTLTYVFNRTTGMSYLMKIPKKTKFKNIRTEWGTSHIINITYSNSNIFVPKCYVLLEDIQEMLDNIYKAVIGKDPENISWLNTSVSKGINIICIKNRLPMINNTSIVKLIGNKPWGGAISRFAKKFISFKSNATPQEVLESLAKKAKCPATKSFKKLVSTDISCVETLKYLDMLGFKSLDVKINNANAVNRCIFNEPFYFNHDDPTTFLPFVRKLIALKGESTAIKSLCCKDHTIFKDAARLYNKLSLLDVYSDKLLKGNIEEIHDRLSIINDDLAHANIMIPYSDEPDKFNEIIDKVEFRVAKNTSELICIGHKMHICVGNYDDYALAKQSIIISMSKNAQYVGCIELKPVKKQYRLNQVKGYCNHMLFGETAKIFDKWAKERIKNEIIIDSECRDYNELIANFELTVDPQKICTHYEQIGF